MKALHPVPSVLLGLGLATAFLQADTLAVLPGTSIQAKIDEAADGDIIAIFGGTYNQNVVVNKAVLLVELQGQEVSITGSVRFEGVADCPPFDGFSVGSSANRLPIEVIDTTGLVLSNLDHTAGAALHIRGNSQVEITDSSLNDLESHENGTTKITDSSLNDFTIRSVGQTDITRSTADRIEQFGGSLVASDVTITRDSPSDWGFLSHPGALQTVLYRVKAQGCEIQVKSQRNWIGYCQVQNGGIWLGWDLPDGDRKFVVVGTEVDRGNRQWERPGVAAYGRAGSIVIANCWIHGMRAHSNNTAQDSAIHVRYPNHPLLIYNNHLEYAHQTGGPWAIHVFDSGDYSKVQIRNNYIELPHNAVAARFGAVVQGNVLRGNALHVGGGVTIAEADANSTLAPDTDPGFEEGTVYRLAPDSVLRDTGTPNPLYNDRDGSRNDAGASGGSWYDPEGWTTDKPVVISFDLTPELVLEGVNTEVTVDEVKAVSAP